eukprot:TRINITY_DN95109_c0_g1_i1.p1 TRINITY_DN95109_c0_g1~~TRINITY_DN95109_c0_g1_i1.p1  ORF type:complete len:470 (-),score=77.13 TRINITY_DN95109_c0_g1_i1:155-1543(-)
MALHCCKGAVPALLVVLLGLALVLPPASGAVLDIVIAQMDVQWQFIAKFCYDNEEKELAKYSWKVDETTNFTNLVLLSYHDGDEYWPAVKRHLDSKQCSGLLSSPPATVSSPLAQAPESHIQILQRSRPRYWYFAVASADCSELKELSFRMTLTLENPGQWWRRHFSWDEHGVLESYVLYSCIFIVLDIYVGLYTRRYIQANGVPQVVSLFLCALIMKTFSVFMCCIHYMAFATNGVGVVPFFKFGLMGQVGARLMGVFLALVISKGFAVAVPLHRADKRVIVSIFLVLLLFNLLLFLFWWADVVAPWSTVYILDTWPGYTISACHGLVAVLFLYWTFHTVRAHRDKFLFYRIFTPVFALWLAMLPIASIASAALDPWVRFKTVHLLLLTADCVVLWFLAFVMHPATVDKYFSAPEVTLDTDFYHLLPEDPKPGEELPVTRPQPSAQHSSILRAEDDDEERL